MIEIITKMDSNTIYKNDIFLKSIKKDSLGIDKLLATLPKVESNINIINAFQIQYQNNIQVSSDSYDQSIKLILIQYRKFKIYFRFILTCELSSRCCVFILFGIDISISDKHSLKVQFPIEVTEEGIDIWSNNIHF